MPSLVEELQQAIAAAEQRAATHAGDAFAARAAAIALLERHVLDRLSYLGEREGLPEEVRALEGEAAALCQRLEALNQGVVQALRDRIRSGRYTAESLRLALVRHAGPPGKPGSYDVLDQLVGGLLDAGPVAEERAVREPEMVFFQATPARAILELVERGALRPDDVVYDLGSGLGRVVVLVALLSGSRAKGVELEPAYCEYAARCVRALDVPRVELIHGDARDVPLSDGTVFFLYTPFRGALLRQVLERLRQVASERPIRVCTYGPCTAEVASADWLRAEEGRALDERTLAVFRSV